MEASEAQELKEHAEHGSHEAALRPVAFTMSVLAVLVAVTTVLGHRTHTEAVLDQNKATDQWNEYQAKKIRDYSTSLAQDGLKIQPISNKDEAEKKAKEYAAHRAKWADELPQDQKQAEALEAKVDQAEARADRLDLAEALLDIGLVITSVTLLTRSRIYWYLGLVFSVFGIASAVWGMLR
ncbi:MAG: DUF4337 domain-containing protein [Terracidiphilus sp.]|jgi:type II secretory pathway component PulM